MEVEACGCALTCSRHGEDEIRSGAKAWAKKTKAAGRQARVGNVDCVFGYFVKIEEGGKEMLEDVVCCAGERSIPLLPGRVWDVPGEVVHDV